MVKKTPEPKPTPNERPPLSGSAAVAAIADAVAEAGLPVLIIDATACPVCGASRSGLRPTDPCPVDGHQPKDAP